MRVPVSLFLAMRYLKPSGSFLYLVITLIAIIGPMLGVAILIIVISVMSGFGHDLKNRIFGMNAHLKLYPEMTSVIEDPEPYIQRLKELSPGIHAAPVVEGPVFVQHRRNITAKMIKGILPEADRHVSDLHQHIIAGDYNVDEGEILIGRALAYQLGVWLGDTLVIHPTGKYQNMVSFDDEDQVSISRNEAMFLPEEVTITGIFEMGMYQYDANIIIMHLENADEIFDIPWGAATSVQIRTEDPFNLKPYVDAIADDPRFIGVYTRTWHEENKNLFDALMVEKNLQFFLLIFIVVVAAFTISSTLITVVIKKTREIGVLKAIGMHPLRILSIFTLQGAAVGLVGVSLGVVAGLLITVYRNHIAGVVSTLTGIDIFPPELYFLPNIPAVIDPAEIARIGVLAFILCIIGALLPALYAACIRPTVALQAD